MYKLSESKRAYARDYYHQKGGKRRVQIRQRRHSIKCLRRLVAMLEEQEREHVERTNGLGRPKQVRS